MVYPPGALLSVNLIDVEGVLRATRVPKHGLDTVAEMCFIALIAYFESFFRNYFASLLNICPELIRELKRKGRDVSVDASTLLSFKENSSTRLGFLLAERYEFGTARTINGLYMDLLLVTPFSKDEGAQFEKQLNDRNLLVHHGGIYTSRYAGQAFIKRRTRQRIFFNSLVVRRKEVRSTASFITGIAKKTMAATQAALTKYITDQKIRISQAQNQAVRDLVSW